MAIEKGAGKALLLTFLVVESFTLPVFRSGGRTGLTFWGWIFNHTIFGPPVEYVPEEDYMAELYGSDVHGLLQEGVKDAGRNFEPLC